MKGPTLRDGETLLWSGRPEEGVEFDIADILISMFGIAWVVVVILGMFGMLGEGDNSVPIVMGLLSVAMGLYVAAGRFMVDIWRRRGTRYYLTDQRAVIETFLPFRRSQSEEIVIDMPVEYEEGRFLSVWFGKRPRVSPARSYEGLGAPPLGFVFERLDYDNDLRHHIDRLSRGKQ